MVTRNEATRYLEPCLESLTKIVDDVVIMDDRSTDDTIDICKAHGATVTSRPAGVPSFVEDESAFRSAAWRTLRAAAGRHDWILCVDADEMLIARLGEVRRWLDRMATLGEDVDGYSLKVREVFEIRDGVPMIRTDGYWGQITALRFCRWVPDDTFWERTMGCGSVPKRVRIVSQAHSVEMLHYGYARPEDRDAKHRLYTARSGHNISHVRSILTRPTLEPYLGISD